MASPGAAAIPLRPTRDFAQQSGAERAVGLLFAPAVMGAASGVLLGVSAPAYWVLQVVATVGGLLGGTEHVGWRPGLARGLVGGAVYGVALLLARALTGWSDDVDLGSTPALVAVITTVLGLVIGAAGGAIRGHRG